jgi:hypothetical protein
MAALGMMGRRDYSESRQVKAALARDLMLKRMLGFPPETETRLAGLIRNLEKIKSPTTTGGGGATGPEGLIFAVEKLNLRIGFGFQHQNPRCAGV